MPETNTVLWINYISIKNCLCHNVKWKNLKLHTWYFNKFYVFTIYSLKIFETELQVSKFMHKKANLKETHNCVFGGIVLFSIFYNVF